MNIRVIPNSPPPYLDNIGRLLNGGVAEQGEGSDMHSKMVALMAAAGLGVAGAVVAQTPAMAVGCYGDYCSGKDPESTGCSADGITVASARIPGSYTYIELRWSATCKTNWARVPSSWGTSSPSLLQAYQCATGYNQSGVVASNGSYSWTRQIYSPKLGVSARWTGSPGTTGTACA